MNREQAKTEIKRAIPCTDYLEKSKNNMYCCPNCGSGHGKHGTGAVKYYSETNTWHCHACDQGGDVIDAYTLQEGCDYNTALSFLAARAGVTIDSRPTAAQDFADNATERPQSDETNQKATQGGRANKTPQNGNNVGTQADYRAYYNECCERITDPAASSYLAARGISLETAKAYRLGYDPQADPASAPGGAASSYKPHPTPRIIAPCSRSFYIARSIDPATPAAFKAPNPKGSKTTLFNAAAVNSAGIVFITEGIFDALSFIEAGQAAISLNGKGNGKLLAELLQEKPTQAQFIICNDNDDDPETAADTMKRARELNNTLRSMNIKSIVYNVAGEYHDANEALTADHTAFKQNIAAAIKELQRDELSDFWDSITTEAYRPHRTGLQFFDRLLGGGIIQQSLILLMAAPGAGKTTLAQQLAEALAKERRPVLYFNFEMSREQMLAKAISAKLFSSTEIKKTATEILQGYKWTDAERSQIANVIDDYRRTQYPFIKYNPADTSTDLDGLLSYLTATGEAAKARGEQAPAAVIDYLHLITSSKGLEMQELIKQAVKGLKDYAVKYNTFVIGIVASNRESNKTGRLTMESARDSSNLEYTADVQISLNYEEIDSGDIKPNDAEKLAQLQQRPQRKMILRVLKNRFGIQGSSQLVTFDAAHNMFYSVVDEFTDTGFTIDNRLPAFDEEEPQTILTI